MDYAEEMKEMLKPIIYGRSEDKKDIPVEFALVKVANWFMTHINEPNLVSDKSLSAAFNVQDKGYDEAWIWWSILLLPMVVKNEKEDTDDSLAYISRLYGMCIDALPDDMKGLLNYRVHRSIVFSHLDAGIQEKIMEFNTWLKLMRRKLETFFIKHYWTGNKMKQIEFLLNKLYREDFNDCVSPFRFQANKVLENAKEVQIELVEAQVEN